MRKYYLSFVFLALFFVSCQANQPSIPVSSQTEFNTSQPNPSIKERESSMTVSYSNTESSSTIIWVEEGERPVFDETGLRTIGIRFREIDLSMPVDGSNDAWDEQGLAIEPRSDLTQILGRSITTRDEAAYVANKILASEQKNGGVFGGEELELMRVEHDPNENVWIFKYWENTIPSSEFCIAIDGNNGELIRMWVY